MSDSPYPPVCNCRERYEATARFEFVYATDLEGWFFRDGPIRFVSIAAAYWQSERGIENHTGEPYLYHACPFCGLDLPVPFKATECWDGSEM